MQDIIEARKRIRELVTPLKRELDSYQLEERLGVWFGQNLNEDAFRVSIEISITPSKDYPSVIFPEAYATVRVSAPSRAEAIAEAYSNVDGLCPRWRRDIEIDQAFSKAVGQQVRILREVEEFVINQDDERKQLGEDQREEVTFEPGAVLNVVGHEPGKLIVQLGEKQFNAHFWLFTNYVTQCENSRDPGIRIPTPYLEFTNGYVPWVLGVDEYL